MKILIITDYWKNSPGGGILNYLINLVDELKKRSNLLVNIAFKEGEDPENYKIDTNRLLFPIKSIFVSNKIRPKFVLSQETWYCLLAGYICSKLYGSRLIHTFHTEPFGKLPKFGKLFMEFLLNRCDYVIFVSHGLENKINDMWKLNFKSKRVVIYAGVNFRDVSDDEIKKFSTKFNIRNDQIILLAQGLTAHSCKAEGAKILIKAVQILKYKYPNLVLILTREGRFSDELKEFVKNEKAQNYIIFTGDVDNPYVPLKLCDIYTHTPLCEALGIAILEAMIMSKPIVATSIGGIPEAIEDYRNGLLVEPNIMTTVQKIELLITNKELAQKLGQNAKNTAEEKFTWKISVDNLMNILKEL